MSLRIPMACFKSFYMKKTQLIFCANTNFIQKCQFSSSPNSIQTLMSETEETIQFPKHVQPLVNQSVDEILSALDSKSVTANESVSILKALRMLTLFKNIKSDDFRNDIRFKTLCNVFEKNCNMMYPNLLVSGLRSLLEVGVSPNSSYVTAAEINILNSVQLFSTLNLIGCLYFHHKFMETDLQKKVVLSLASELCSKISEVTSNAEVLMLVHFLHIFSGNDQKQVQSKIVDLIKILNCYEMCKMFTTLAENSNRNLPILNALAFHLRQKQEGLQVKEILDILYAFKKLNFCDLLLLSNFMNKVTNEIPTVKQPSIISGLLTVCGHLRVRHTGFLASCAEWVATHTEICRTKEFVSFILTIANLNYGSSEIGVQKALQVILPLLTFEKVESPDVWLDVVWSLAILNITDKEMLLNVFSSNFYKPLIDNSGFQTTTNKLKLMNLKAVLRTYYPDCVFSCDLFLDPLEVPQSSEIENNRRHILKVLSNLVTNEKYLCTNQNTDMGIFIDAEFIMDKNLKSLPLSEFGILSKVTNTKTLPKGAQRIALLILFYKDFTRCSPSRTGFNELIIRLLFSRGYTPVPISYDEFIRNNTEVKKTKYLLQKIRTIMRKVEENKFKFSVKIYD